jgi:putative transposase
MKNCLLLEVYHLLGALEAEFEAIDIYYQYRRYYESLNNVPPVHAYIRRVQAILWER